MTGRRVRELLSDVDGFGRDMIDFFGGGICQKQTVLRHERPELETAVLAQTGFNDDDAVGAKRRRLRFERLDAKVHDSLRRGVTLLRRHIHQGNFFGAGRRGRINPDALDRHGHALLAGHDGLCADTTSQRRQRENERDAAGF